MLAVLLLATGCKTSTTSLFTASGPSWHVQQGQALWRPRSGFPELGGDLVMASDDAGRCFLEFSKTPMTLVSVQTTPKQWLIQFPPRDYSFTGHRRPPARFLWLHLPAALAGQPPRSPLRFERKPDGGWRLENTSSGESVEGFLGP